jgi:putative phage-type endonuclease
VPPLTQANHQIRANNVAASEVGALLGLHPYMTAGQVWDRLNGLLIPRSPSLAMEFGSNAEPLLVKFAERELGCRIRMNSRTYEHPRVPLCATPDAFVVGTRQLVEFKTSWSKYRWEHGLPSDVEWQVRAQMACTHRDETIVYVFSGEQRIFRVKRHRGKERQMTQAVERFWNENMATGIRPVDTGRPVAKMSYEGKTK